MELIHVSQALLGWTNATCLHFNVDKTDEVTHGIISYEKLKSLLPELT